MEENRVSEGVARRILIALGLGGVGSVAAVATLPRIGWKVALVILALLLLLLGGYFAWVRLKRVGLARRFAKFVDDFVNRTPAGVKDPVQLARIDQLRKRFLDGLKVYTARGKDIYSVPWYVIIGQSGSGKTEAIRHSNLDFPPGLNDFQQGVGGTLNMDWWFTNHGVILDTAGSLVFPEMGADAPESPLWLDFLEQLKLKRPNCPLNGLILVLSVDSLISDSASVIAQKAGAIARQLAVIQHKLEIRFPVTVLVTKCDKLTGFKEFFENIEEVELQDQMVGWSNPEPLDAPFREDQVDLYMDRLIHVLRKRRLGLLKEPVASHGPRARRADEVDSLYALPKSLSLITPRLRRYLTTLFKAGEFSHKPVFLRGIYFTSAMQVGADMDEAVWAALGRPPFSSAGSAQTAGPGEVGKPFFLRDVFLEKIFRERGLVTRAVDTRKMLRQRTRTLAGVVAACLALFLLLSWYTYDKLKREVISASASFRTVSGTWGNRDSNGWWNPVVEKSSSDPWKFIYVGDTRKVADTVDATLSSFHAQLRQDAETNLTSWVFLPARFLRSILGVEVASREKRMEAQQKVFEQSVLRPLLTLTRQKMESAEANHDAPQRHADALKALIRLERDIHTGDGLTGTNSLATEVNYIVPLLSYLTENDRLSGGADLSQTFFRTYSKTHGGHWPPEDLSGGNGLDANVPIREGLHRHLSAALNADTNLVVQHQLLSGIVTNISRFKEEEQRWIDAVDKEDLVIDEERFLALREIMATRQNDFRLAISHGLFTSPRSNTLAQHRRELADRRRGLGLQSVEEILDVLPQARGQAPLSSAPSQLSRLQHRFESVLNAIRTAIPGRNTRLIEEIHNRLTEHMASLTNAVEAAKLDEEYAALDNGFLNYPGPNEVSRAMELRFQIYTQAYEFSRLYKPDRDPPIGDRFVFLTSAAHAATNIRASANAYAGFRSNELGRVVGLLLRRGTESLANDLFEQYATKVDAILDPARNLSRPVTFEGLAAYGTNLAAIETDLTATNILSLSQRARLEGMPNRLAAARKRAMEWHMADWGAALSPYRRFPAHGVNATHALTLDELRNLKTLLQSLNQQLADEALAAFGPLRQQALPNELKKFAIVETLFADETHLARFTIHVAPEWNDRNVIGRAYGLAITEESHEARDISRPNGAKYGPFTVDSTLTFVSTKFPNDRTPGKTTAIGRWAGLQLVTNPAYKAQPTHQPGEYEVSIALSAVASQPVKARIIFDKNPFPNWPVQ